MDGFENSYSLLKIEITDEVHIFKGQFMNGNCSLRMYSMCEKVSRLNTKTITVEKCLDHSEVKVPQKLWEELSATFAGIVWKNPIKSICIS